MPDIIFNDADMPSTQPSEKDDLYNYNCCLINYGLLFTEFLDAIAEGDGDRNLRCWKMFLLHFKNDAASTKYALEALYYTIQVNCLLTPRQAYRLMWNRSVRCKGCNVPLDLQSSAKKTRQESTRTPSNVGESVLASFQGITLKFNLKFQH